MKYQGAVTEPVECFCLRQEGFEMINEAGEAIHSEMHLYPDGSGKAVEARNVSFGYTKDTKVLRDMGKLYCKAGCSFAIVGPTGW